MVPTFLLIAWAPEPLYPPLGLRRASSAAAALCFQVTPQTNKMLPRHTPPPPRRPPHQQLCAELKAEVLPSCCQVHRALTRRPLLQLSPADTHQLQHTAAAAAAPARTSPDHTEFMSDALLHMCKPCDMAWLSGFTLAAAVAERTQQTLINLIRSIVSVRERGRTGSARI